MGLISQQIRTTNPETPSPVSPALPRVSNGSLGGIFINAFRDLGSIASGLGAMGGALLHDVGHAATLGAAFDDFVLDDIVKGIPTALKKDYAQRYGGGIKGIAKGVYEHPLFFLQDVLMVASAGGYGVAKAAQATAKSAEVGAAAKALGASTVAEEAAMAAKGVLAASDISDAAKFVQAVQGVSTKIRNPLTGRVEEVAPAFNPVRRALGQNLYIKALSDRGGRAAELVERYKQTAAVLGEEGLAYANTAERIAKNLDAAIRNGERVLRPSVATHKLLRLADFIWGGQRRLARQFVEDTDKAIEAALKPLVEAGLEPEAVYDMLTGVDTTLLNDGYVPAPGAGLRDTEIFKPPASGPVLPESFDNGIRWADNLTVDDALAQATADRAVLTPRLREALRNEATVIAPEPKSLEAIRLKAALTNGDIPDDVSRFRVIIPEYAPSHVERVLNRITEETGGVVQRLENTVYRPDAGGERYVRAVVQMPDGHPVEFQVVTPRAARTLDVTSEFARQAKLAVIKAETDPDFVLVATEVAKKMNMASQTAWSGVTAEVRAALGGPPDNVFRMAIHDTRLEVLERLTVPALKNDTLTPLSMFDNPYLPLRVQNGATWSAKLKELVGGGTAGELWDLNAKAGLPQPVYFPMVSVHHVPQRGAALAKVGGRGPLAVIDDRFLKKNSGELVAKGLQLKDPLRAYHIRAQAAAVAEESLGLVNRIVTETGRQLHNFDEAGVDEVVLSRTHLRNLFNTRRAVEDAALEAAQLGEDSVKHIARALEQALVENQAAFAQLDNPDLIAVPRAVYDRLQAQGKLYLGQNVDLAFKTPTQLWKSMVLAGSPRWVVNNIIGNITFLKMQGGRLSDVIRQLDPEFRRAIKEAMGEHALRDVEGGLIKSVQNTGGRFTEDTLAGIVANRLKESRVTQGILRYPRKWRDFAQGLNSEAEDAFRRASYLTAAEREAERLGINKAGRSFWTSKETLEDVFRVGLDEKSTSRAVAEVNKFLNDYHNMTPFGRNVLRPYIAPFWSFYRHATKLLLQSPYENPLKTRIAALVDQDTSDQLSKLGELPAWMRGTSLYLGTTSAGEARFLSTAGANPFNIVMETPGQILNPAWKVLFEQTTGHSMFTGRAFTSPNVVETPFGGLFRVEEGPGGELTAQPIEKNAPGLLEHFLQQVPQYELVKDIIAGGTTYDTATLFQVLRGEGTILDPETGRPLRARSAAETLARLFGYSTYPVDLLKFQVRRAQAAEAAITAYRRRLAAQAATTS